MADTKKSFIATILDLFFFDKADPKRDKQKMLKSIESLLKKKSRYFKVATLQVQPSLAKFFFDIYTVVTPIVFLLQNVMKSDQLKAITIESFLTDDLKKSIARLQPEELEKLQHEKANMRALQDQLRADVNEVINILSASAVATQINILYSYVLLFSEFVMFDYYTILRSCDPDMPEHRSDYRPNFRPTQVSQIIEMLDEFLYEATAVIGYSEWDSVFKILATYRNSEVIPDNLWAKTLQSTKEMVHSKLLEQIIQIAKEDPYYEVRVQMSVTDIVKPYVANIRKQLDRQLTLIDLAERNKASTKILVEIFNTTELSSYLRYYSAERNRVFLDKALPGFEYCDILNTVVVFNHEYLTKDIKSVVDLLILKGKWSQNIHYKDFSDSFQALLSSTDEILAFDETLADESSLMMRLRTLMRSSETDKFARNTLTGLLGEINDDAHDLVSTIANHYMTLGRYLKIYIDDYRLQVKSEVIINWKEIEKSTDRQPFKRFLGDTYKKVYYLVQMLQQYTKKE